MIEEFERIALTVDIPQYHLRVGDMGTVVDMTPNRQQYTVEFFTLDGETFAVVPLTPSQIRRVGSRQGNCFKFYIWVTKVHYLPQRTQSSRRKESLFLFLCVLRVLCGSKKLLTDSLNFEAITLWQPRNR